ncbi:MAG: hypothetical protein OEY07_14280, partial [Gammaproteobacteria bacterium]|nr:hypothetical protein [Gammaproteobacteria bacterium]
PADRSVQETADTQWHYDPTSVESMSAYLETLSVDESVIWQRIFETESGFPAPQAQPQVVPGSRPW